MCFLVLDVGMLGEWAKMRLAVDVLMLWVESV